MGEGHWSERLRAWAREHPGLIDLASAAALTAVLLPWTASATTGEAKLIGALAAHEAARPWVLAAATGGHLAVALRRRNPPVAHSVIALATVVLLVTSSGLVLPSAVVLLVSVHTCARHGTAAAAAWALPCGVVVVVGGTCAGLAVDWRPSGLGDLLLRSTGALLPLVLAAFSWGMYGRIRQAHVAMLRERARRAEAERDERARRAVAEERARIARDMHDVLAHSLSVVLSQARGGRYAARAEPDTAVRALSTIAETAQHALADVRGLLRVLRPEAGGPESGGSESGGSEAGGSEAGGDEPAPTLADLPDLVRRTREAGLVVRHTEHGEPACPERMALSPAAEIAVVRLVQEALTNTLQHAPGAEADVRLRWSDAELAVSVDDTGPATTHATERGGHGLVGMRERAEVVGGAVEAGPARGGGFHVHARFPLRARV